MQYGHIRKKPDSCKQSLKGNIMNNPKFFRNAALVFGLLATGSSFAEVEVTSTPPGPGSSYATEIRSKMANMTPAERDAYRKQMEAKMEGMTPEERKAYRKEMAGQNRSQMANMTPEEREAFHEKVKAERRERHELKKEMKQEMKVEKREMKLERQEMRQDRPQTDDMRGAGSRSR